VWVSTLFSKGCTAAKAVTQRAVTNGSTALGIIMGVATGSTRRRKRNRPPGRAASLLMLLLLLLLSLVPPNPESSLFGTQNAPTYQTTDTVRPAIPDAGVLISFSHDDRPVRKEDRKAEYLTCTQTPRKHQAFKLTWRRLMLQLRCAMPQACATTLNL
jgi:hypothetical protein